MVLVHYIPGFLFAKLSFQGLVLKFGKSMLNGKSASHRLSDSPSFLLNIQKPTLRLGESGSRFSITNISANSTPKAERLERYCKGSMRNQFLQNPRQYASLPCPFKGRIFFWLCIKLLCVCVLVALIFSIALCNYIKVHFLVASTICNCLILTKRHIISSLQ